MKNKKPERPKNVLSQKELNFLTERANRAMTLLYEAAEKSRSEVIIWAIDSLVALTEKVILENTALKTIIEGRGATTSVKKKAQKKTPKKKGK